MFRRAARWTGPKVFCVGRNKTGTTSLARALHQLGLRVGSQARAERLIEDWARRDFQPIVDYCRVGDAFQDVPFSLPFTYQAVDQAFPGSKFILTVRRSPQAWYESLTRFHAKIIGTDDLPTADDLKRFAYRRTPGMIWRGQQLVYGVDESSLYDRKRYEAHYLRHNADVAEYFQHRPDDLLVLNVAEPDAMESLCRFLGVESRRRDMPHLNQS